MLVDATGALPMLPATEDERDLADVLALVGADIPVAPTGRRRIGPVEPFRLWSISAVVRVPTDNGAFWCKAACDHFRAEPRIHTAVAALFPDLVPRVVAVEAAEGWALMEPMTGTEPSAQPAGVALEVAGAWAAAQPTSSPGSAPPPTGPWR